MRLAVGVHRPDGRWLVLVGNVLVAAGAARGAIAEVAEAAHGVGGVGQA